MNSNIKKMFQIFFLGLFIFLLFEGRVQIWVGLFLIGLIVSLVFGRYYCGWICSINTVLSGVTWIKKKLHINSLKIPQFFVKPWIRNLSLSLFISVFTITLMTGTKLPVFPVLFVIAILLTFIYPEEMWHRYLCPYGTLLNSSAKHTKHAMKIEEFLCNNCGACKRVCPAKAVVKTESEHHISKSDCLVCMQCEDSCKQRAISYK